ncbi:maternal B9.10 protein-like [Hemitrygon akajei]|uniref:maternal B9.10 protein-like n=1 Tax=Hemitrygon akajei TaxID=2704970 RepID=UPI003BF9EE89
MKEEIAATVVFITRLVKKNEKFSKQKIEKFGNKLTKILFEKYKDHWYWTNPPKGQAYRCIRVNRNQPRDPILFQACVESNIEYSSLELPQELTIWVDPYEVWCRCGEKNQPFIVTKLEEKSTDVKISKYISHATERVTSEDVLEKYSDEDGYNEEQNAFCTMSNAYGEAEGFSEVGDMTIPIVSNPNSIYQVEDYNGVRYHGEIPQTIPTVINPNSIYQYNYYTYPAAGWPRFVPRKSYVEDCNGYYAPQKIYKMYRVSNMFTVPYVDRYHWVNTKR